MMNRVGFNLQSVPRQSVGFGNTKDEEVSEKEKIEGSPGDKFADKTAKVAEFAQNNIAEPVTEGAVLVVATGASSSKLGGMIKKIVDKPLNGGLNATTGISTKGILPQAAEFLAKHTPKILPEQLSLFKEAGASSVKNTGGLINRILGNCKPLVKIVSEQGPDAAEYLTKKLQQGSSIAIKCFAGLIGFIAVAKEFPKIKEKALNIFKDLGSAAIATDIINN
jgi:hypothetical protein